MGNIRNALKLKTLWRLSKSPQSGLVNRAGDANHRVHIQSREQWEEISGKQLSVGNDFAPTQSVVNRSRGRLLEVGSLRPIRLCDLRHTAASLGVAVGVSVKALSEQLGHVSIAFTPERYSHTCFFQAFRTTAQSEWNAY